MKKMKKITAIMLALLMAGMFAACGGGATEGPGEVPPDPNDGLKGIVYTAPEGWEKTGVYVGEFSKYTKDGSGDWLFVQATDEAALSEMKEYSEEIQAENIDEYYVELVAKAEEEKEENHSEIKDVNVGGMDGKEIRYRQGDGYGFINTIWVSEGVLYSMTANTPSDYDDDGNPVESDNALTDDEIASYEALVAGVHPGEGAALQTEGFAMNRIGSLTFEVPEGYTVKTVDQNYVNIEKDGEDTSISIKRSTEDDIAWLEDENGNAPTTLEEAFAIQTKNVDKNDDSQKVTIAGREGYMEEFGSGEGEKHVIQAHFLTDDALYTVELSTKQKDDYSEDKETFKAFIDTLKME